MSMLPFCRKYRQLLDSGEGAAGDDDDDDKDGDGIPGYLLESHLLVPWPWRRGHEDPRLQALLSQASQNTWPWLAWRSFTVCVTCCEQVSQDTDKLVAVGPGSVDGAVRRGAGSHVRPATL